MISSLGEGLGLGTEPKREVEKFNPAGWEGVPIDWERELERRRLAEAAEAGGGDWRGVFFLGLETDLGSFSLLSSVL